MKSGLLITLTVSTMLVVGVWLWYAHQSRTETNTTLPVKGSGANQNASALVNTNATNTSGSNGNTRNANVIAENRNVAFRCILPCTGIAVDPQEGPDCGQQSNQESCEAYYSNTFPYRCEWAAVDRTCPPYP